MARSKSRDFYATFSLRTFWVVFEVEFFFVINIVDLFSIWLNSTWWISTWLIFQIPVWLICTFLQLILQDFLGIIRHSQVMHLLLMRFHCFGTLVILIATSNLTLDLCGIIMFVHVILLVRPQVFYRFELLSTSVNVTHFWTISISQILFYPTAFTYRWLFFCFLLVVMFGVVDHNLL